MTQRIWELEPDQPRYELRDQPIKKAGVTRLRMWDNIRHEWANHIYEGPAKEQKFVDQGNEWWDKINERRAYAKPVSVPGDSSPEVPKSTKRTRRYGHGNGQDANSNRPRRKTTPGDLVGGND